MIYSERAQIECDGKTGLKLLVPRLEEKLGSGEADGSSEVSADERNSTGSARTDNHGQE